ncbi:MAG: molybdenum cofactor guanylyltransferase [Putridiphycobacter sp.]
MSVTGIILAGGKSSRMKQDKGLLLFQGIPMVQYSIELLKPLVTEIIIVANHSGYNQFGEKVVEDQYQNKGPVGGIFTGLSASSTKFNFVLSCDTPFVSEALLRHLFRLHQKSDVTIPAFNGKIHPLIGLYNSDLANDFEKAILQNELKLMSVNQRLNYNVVNLDSSDFSEQNFINLNSTEDIQKVNENKS